MLTLQETYECENPVALITGSGSPRVGRRIAMWLADRGCRIALHAKDQLDSSSTAEALSRLGKNVLVTRGALDDSGTCERIVAETCDTFGRIDILINSAAIWSPVSLEKVTAELMKNYYDVNVVGSFLCAQAAGMRMIEQNRGGCIVNLGDWATTRPYLDYAAYFPTKGAIEVMTRSLAVEFGARNRRVRVNCIQPGPVMFADDVPESTREKVNSASLSEPGSADHIAHAVQFLCENDFVTGVCLHVDGGRQIYANDGMQIGLNLG